MSLLARRLALIVAVVPTIAKAQHASLLAHVGDRVRITAPESGIDVVTGRLVAADSMLYTVKGTGPRVFYYIHRAEIEAFDISAASRTNMLGGMSLGALNGLMMGIGIGSMQANKAQAGPQARDPERQGALFGTIGGAVLGGLIGLAITTDDWVPVDVDTPAKVPPANKGHPSASYSAGRITLRWSVTY